MTRRLSVAHDSARLPARNTPTETLRRPIRLRRGHVHLPIPLWGSARKEEGENPVRSTRSRPALPAEWFGPVRRHTSPAVKTSSPRLPPHDADASSVAVGRGVSVRAAGPAHQPLYSHSGRFRTRISAKQQSGLVGQLGRSRRLRSAILGVHDLSCSPAPRASGSSTCNASSRASTDSAITAGAIRRRPPGQFIPKAAEGPSVLHRHHLRSSTTSPP